MKLSLLPLLMLLSTLSFGQPEYYVRYEHQGQTQYGRLNDSVIQPLQGDLFGILTPVGKLVQAQDVKLKLPTDAQKVFAVGMNFASHLASAPDAPPPLFLKLPTSLTVSGEPVNLPFDAYNVHFEGELVLVIGKQVKNISESEAKSAIWGVTVGNDLTERSWQSSDLQWMRAKASDGFGPIGPVIARGIDYNNLLLTTRLNGKVVQQENTKNMIHKPAKVVSYLSKYFTLMPGDLIFMGTPGRTQSLKQGDVVSVTIDQVGMVENTVRVIN